MSNLLKNENIEISGTPYETIRVKRINRKSSIPDAESKAKTILDKATEAAEEINRNAVLAAKKEFEIASERGFAEGFNKGQEQATEKYNAGLEEIKRIISELEANKISFLTENRSNIIELAFKVAEKVVNRKLTEDQGLFLDIYEKAVKDIVAQKWVRLSVSDSDAVFATSHSDQLLGMVSGAERINIKVLDNAPKGSCIVETAEKIVDSGIDTQLSFLKKAANRLLQEEQEIV
ncbi:MAG: FliH/SctL family protein [Eubacteriales bacterium]|nr:FliH/SctL family protein [Eubacteriales bacterium]MDD4422571.1 FliH/SctL family protein [Eubacteriales bacterium]